MREGLGGEQEAESRGGDLCGEGGGGAVLGMMLVIVED